VAAYIVPMLLCVAILFGGVVACVFYQAIRSAPGSHAAEKLPADESEAALKDRTSQP